MKKGNIFENIPKTLNEELFEDIFKTKNIRIQRIVSDEHSSYEDFWYDQQDNELVFLIQGSSEIRFEDETVILKKGDWLLIPSHKKHRVESTDKNQKTIWIAIFY
jgi:cupin 2 domain-containing protein